MPADGAGASKNERKTMTCHIYFSHVSAKTEEENGEKRSTQIEEKGEEMVMLNQPII